MFIYIIGLSIYNPSPYVYIHVCYSLYVFYITTKANINRGKQEIRRRCGVCTHQVVRTPQRRGRRVKKKYFKRGEGDDAQLVRACLPVLNPKP